jgi:uncharacterized membrane protein HdeD (DUF308 family)
MSENTSASPASTLSHSRGWLIAGGLLSILVGFLAMGSPLLFSVVLAQFLGIFALVSGVISLFVAIFSKQVTHRVLEALLAVIRIIAGIVLLRCITSSIAVITLILAVFLIVEGIFSIIGAFKMRQHYGWVWTLINGIGALVLGVMVYNRWPSNSAWVLGMLYGINSIFWGVSLLTLGTGAPKPATP